MATHQSRGAIAPLVPRYKIVGASDCPYFARAERLAYLLMARQGLTAQDIVIEMRPPQDWASYYDATCKSLNYTRITPAPRPTLERPTPLPVSPRTDRVIIWSPAARTVVGGELEWKQRCLARYGVSCDWDWDRCLGVAKANKELHMSRVAYLQQRPIVMLLSGPPLSGKRTLAPRLCAAHSLHHVHSGALLAAAARTDTPAGRSVRAWLLARTRRLARYAARARARVLAASAAAAAAATGAGDAEESTEDAEIVRLVTGGTTNASAAGSNRSSARPGGAGAHSSRHSAADAAAAARHDDAGHAGGGDHADSDDSDCDNDDDDDDDDWCDGAGSLGDAASAVAGAAFCPQDADLLSYLTGTGAELNPTAAAARTLALDSASATAQAHTTREYAAASAVLSALYAADIADAADAADAAVTAGGAAPPVLPTELLGVGAGLDAGLGSVLAPLRLLRRRPQHPPTALVWPLVKQALSSALARTAPRTAGAASPAEARHGVLLEGFPRCDEQAVLLAQFLAERDATVDAAVVLDVSEDEATKRARARVIEPTTDMSFSLAAVAAAGSTGSGEEAKQDMESPLLLSRVDDHPRAVRARFRDWHESACAVLHGTLPVLLPRCKIVTVDGAMKQEEVLAAVSVELETCRELSKAL